MQKLKHCVEESIHKIVDGGINARNLGVLGDLVDILKDAEEICHYRDMKGSHGESSESMRDFLDTVQSMEPSKLYEYAEAIKKACESVSMPADMSSKFKTLFK